MINCNAYFEDHNGVRVRASWSRVGLDLLSSVRLGENYVVPFLFIHARQVYLAHEIPTYQFVVGQKLRRLTQWSSETALFLP